MYTSFLKLVNGHDNGHDTLFDGLNRPLYSNKGYSWNDKCDYIERQHIKNLDHNNTNLTCIQLNIRGLLGKISEIKNVLRELKENDCTVDLFLISETMLGEIKKLLVKLLGYAIISHERTSKKGGGVCIIIKDQLHYKIRNDLDCHMDSVFESIFIELVS